MSQTEDLIAALWRKNLPKILTYVDLLEHAAHAALLIDEQRKEASSAAHKLAGCLGMYGYPAGTEAARQLEQELDRPTPDPATLKHLTQLLRLALSS